MKFKSAFWRVINYVKLKRAGVSVAKIPDIKYRVDIKIDANSIVKIGNDFTMYSEGGLNPLGRNARSSICVEKGAQLIVGDNVGISNSVLWSKKSIVIGNRVTIGANVSIFDSDCHSLNFQDRGTEYDMKNTRCKSIVIEDDVLVGTGSYILKGCVVGARSIIAAGSVVVKDVPADCVVAGNPAKVVKHINQ